MNSARNIQRTRLVIIRANGAESIDDCRILLGPLILGKSNGSIS